MVQTSAVCICCGVSSICPGRRLEISFLRNNGRGAHFYKQTQMRLTIFTDYAVRTLLHLGSNRERLITIEEIASLHQISRNHLVRVVGQLSTIGVVETVRGRKGGMRLKLEPSQISLGDIVVATENDLYMAQCFNPNSLPCVLIGDCRFKGLLDEATQAYLAVLDRTTLASLLQEPVASSATLTFHRKPSGGPQRGS